MPAPRPRRVILSVFVILAALAVFGGIAGYAYDWDISQFETTRVPVILADSGPIKPRPESPGGLNVPNQDVAVLNDGASDPANPQVERLLPPPKTPLPPQTESAEAEVITEPEAMALAALAAAPLPEPPAASLSAPSRPVHPRDLSHRLRPGGSPQALRTPPAPQVAAPQVASPQIAALPPATVLAGLYVAQLAALKSHDGARPAWGSLQKAHTALLSWRELAIQEINLGERGIFYRVQAGYFPDRASALELCTALKARGQDCFVVKR